MVIFKKHVYFLSFSWFADTALDIAHVETEPVYWQRRRMKGKAW